MELDVNNSNLLSKESSVWVKDSFWKETLLFMNRDGQYCLDANGFPDAEMKVTKTASGIEVREPKSIDFNFIVYVYSSDSSAIVDIIYY